MRFQRGAARPRLCCSAAPRTVNQPDRYVQCLEQFESKEISHRREVVYGLWARSRPVRFEVSLRPTGNGLLDSEEMQHGVVRVSDFILIVGNTGRDPSRLRLP